MSTSFADSTLTINLSTIVSNYELLRIEADNTEVAAVVKANAYGLGVERVALCLSDAGCEKFFVATLDEAVELRSFLPKAQIVVFHGVSHGQESFFKQYKLTPVLNSLYQIDIWKKMSVPAILHVDTGMNRLGLTLKEAEKLSNYSFDFVMSHLACADDPLHKNNKMQLHHSNDIKNFFGLPFSLANSSGIYLGKDYHFDLVRPGSALYGVDPIGGSSPIKNVITVISKILQLREIDSKSTVGYGATHKVKPGDVIAIVPLGYADGYLTYLGGKGKCSIGGNIFDVVGRVSMDMIAVDVTTCKENLKVGDQVQIIGDDINIDQVASYAGTIGYQMLTSLGSRYKRVYIK